MENVIKIYLKEKGDYKNTFNDEILDYGLSNYILEEARGMDTKRSIKFVIITQFELQDNEKNDLVDMIRNNFGADISEIMHLSIKQRIANLLIFFIGIVFLIISSLFEITIISEFILIFGWVFLGEAICNLLYKEIENITKIKRRKQIVNAKVFFENKL